MSILDIARQSFLFMHLLIFAIAIAEILREDWRFFRSETVDTGLLQRTSRNIKFLLTGLWASGIALAWFRTGPELETLLADPKFHAKILVVCALTINGALLHMIAFPTLQGKRKIRTGSAMLMTILGAVSTVSWLFAGFLGTSRIVAPHTSFSEFMALYGFALVSGLLIALTCIQPRIRRLLSKLQEEQMPVKTYSLDSECEARLKLLQQIESAAATLGQAQNQLRAVRAAAFNSTALPSDRDRVGNDSRRTEPTRQEPVLPHTATA